MSMSMGKIWKVANEHVRAGTSEEMRGVEAVQEEIVPR